MDNLSRESTMLSQGTYESILQEIPPGSIDMLLKGEYMPVECQGPYICTDQQMAEVFYSLPDSTEEQTSVSYISPVSTSALPSTEDYPGPCDFNVDMCKSSGDKAKWEYSKSLNKLFVVMDCKIPLKFKTNQKECDLLVRVLPIFLAQDSFGEAVMRCPTHLSSQEKSNKDFIYVNHIIRCHHTGALYQENQESKRLSVLNPLDTPQPGSDWTTVVYSFMCKNSCGLGMNRRSTALIFTLERQNGEVIGRKLINIRICSCPRRDMLKEEQDQKVRKVGDENRQEFIKASGKKPLKRLTKELAVVRVPMKLVKVIKEIILMNETERELTPEEKITLQDCDKYMT